MKIGFTGTQGGMSSRQIVGLTEFFAKYGPQVTEFHHGDCVGADEDADGIANGMLGENKVWIHPPVERKKRAFCRSPHVAHPRPYLDRNRDIVKETDVLIAAPKSKTEVLRSGTWATVRYARWMGKRVLILEP